MSTVGPKAKRFTRPAALSNASEIINPLRDVATPAQLIPLDKVDMDPDNVRPIYLNPEQPAEIDDASPVAARMREQLVDILGLARSIETTGLINAVEVYRRADRYVLVTGQRRFLAHRLLELPMIRASVLMTRPKNLRAQQYIENEQRTDMSLAERIEGLGPVLEESGMLAASLTEQAKYLVEHLGMSRTTAYRYLMLRNAPPDVLDAIRAGYVTGLRTAESLACIEDEGERALALAAIMSNGGGDASVSSGQSGDDASAAQGQGGDDASVSGEPAIAAAPVKRVAGRPATKIKLGAVEQPNVVRGIIRDLLGSEYVPDIDWSDLKAVSKAFQACLPEIAKRYA